ncbi:MAG TPA: TIGR03009 domain-containing protein [Fimbriiglobus sp.]|nr:TIGR03009 domain-containing protein [Fimbriiglobus sp.]
MTRAGLTVAAVLVAVPALAQAPPAAPGGAPIATSQPGGAHLPAPGAAAPAPQPAPELLAHLTGWEKVMQAASSFYCNGVTKVHKNRITRKETIEVGEIMCLKPNMARMRMEAKPAPGQKADPNAYMAYICTGQEVYEYDGNAKVITVYKLANGGVGDNLILEFISGSLKAADVVKRFDLKLLKQDDNYVYLEIKPRLPRDQAEFESMILVLFKPNLPQFPHLAYLPRTVEMRKRDQVETWDFPQPTVVAKGITREHFKFVPVPKELGWKTQHAQQPSAGAPGTPTGQPRVARPMGP